MTSRNDSISVTLRRLAGPALLATALLVATLTQPARAAVSQEQQSLEELRNTITNLLQALVERGVITREQAQAMVKAAEDKAATDAATAAKQKEQQAKEEANAVRVPYVPQIVKDEIRKEVADQLAPQVAQQVEQEAKSEGWGVPAALPDWINRIALSGDVRVRAEADLYGKGNEPDSYLNFTSIDQAGGFEAAGDAAFLNTTQDRYYPLVRLRLNVTALLSGGWFAGARLGTGTLINPDSLNQVEGQYGGRYTTDVDLAFLGWSGGDAKSRQHFTFWAGKYQNPFLYSDLIWMPDVTLEGVTGDYRLRLAGPPEAPRAWFVTLGAIPEEYVPLTYDFGPESTNKWLYAGQTGLDLLFDSGTHLRFGVAYYDFNHMAGELNSYQSTLTNYTAPPYFQKGNTLFPITNNGSSANEIFALASEYHELDGMLALDYMVTPLHRVYFFADAVRNLGYNAAAVAERVGAYVAPRIDGYESMIGFGTPKLDHALAWDAFVGYRYLERDAVVDAFTDQDYHLGGTDAKGYIVGGDLSLTGGVWLRARYMPFTAIDGPPLAIDVVQVDLNAAF